MTESFRTGARLIIGAMGVVLLLLTVATQQSQAVPAFARKYGTSCLTCHTVYPKLNPFGEAFRRNGFRFPGVDSDFVKQDVVALGQDANKKEFPHSVWPGALPASVPLALGFNGQAVIHPNRNAGGAQTDNEARVNLNDVISEGHLWAGGSFDDTITFFGEVTVASDGTDVEHATVHFNDLVGPKHVLNAVVGKNVATLSSFGSHSSYVADMAATPLLVTALYGATSDSWNIDDAYNGLELNGTVGGRFDYAAGLNAGANVDARGANDWYAHVGYKFGGVRLDGEAASAVPDPKKPWAEHAVTVDGFYHRSLSRFTASDGGNLTDETHTWGGGIRAQFGSLEVNGGGYQEKHDHALVDGAGVRGEAFYGEISYVAYPWLVPALRVERLKLKPDGGASVTDLRYVVGAAALVRPNLKFTLDVWIEKATGAPDGGWGPAGGFALPATPTDSVGPEVEAVMIGMAFAF